MLHAIKMSTIFKTILKKIFKSSKDEKSVVKDLLEYIEKKTVVL